MQLVDLPKKSHVRVLYTRKLINILLNKCISIKNIEYSSSGQQREGKDYQRAPFDLKLFTVVWVFCIDILTNLTQKPYLRICKIYMYHYSFITVNVLYWPVPRQIIVTKVSPLNGSQDNWIARHIPHSGASPPVPTLSSIGGFAPNPPNVNTPQNSQNSQNYHITIKVLFAIKCTAIHWAAILLLRSFYYGYLSCS